MAQMKVSTAVLRVEQEEQSMVAWGDTAGRTEGPSPLGETLDSDSLGLDPNPATG